MQEDYGDSEIFIESAIGDSIFGTYEILEDDVDKNYSCRPDDEISQGIIYVPDDIFNEKDTFSSLLELDKKLKELRGISDKYDELIYNNYQRLSNLGRL